MVAFTRALVDRLVAELGERIVLTDPASLDASSHDSWPVSSKLKRMDIHSHRADVVVRVTEEQQISVVLAIADELHVPVTVRSLGSSVTGQPLPVRGGIVLDLSGMARSFSLNTRDLTVTASASFIGGDLEDELVEMGWTMGNSPQSLYRSSVGGWVATMETGQFSSYYGGVEDLLVGFRVILATGETAEISASPRAAMGPDLRQIFIGSEGTLGVVTSVTLKVFPVPESRLFETLSLPSVGAGIECMRSIAISGTRPLLLRLYDVDEARHVLSDAQWADPVLFLGTQGSERLAKVQMEELVEIALEHGARGLGPAGVTAWLGRRYDFSTVEDLLDTEGGYAETIEIAHCWSGIGTLYAEMKRRLAPLVDEVLAHFSHLYTQGSSLYVIVLGKAEDDAAAVEILREVWRVAMGVCLELGAELSHHHGGGLARSPYARQSLGESHLILRKVKAALDPHGILNPGKLGL